MPLRIVQSKHNAWLKELRKALARPVASGGAGSSLAGIEGPNLLSEALRAALRIKCVFAAEGSEKIIEGLRLPAETEILLLPKPLLDAALTTETPQPLAALVEPPDWTWAHLFSGHSRAALVIVLAALQDPGNLGTIVRSAEAFGATGIVSLPGTVSAWNPKAVRASAGSIFRVPVIAASERDCLENLREEGAKILTTTVHTIAQPADLVDMTGSVAFVIGNEGNGVADDLAAKADAYITISCPGPVESLNAAVATSVLLYEASRQRTASAGGSEHRGARR
jgi:RNA methyltransferase, TrmH family